jgi:peptide/nickel transport system ATP-binding protein
MALVEIRNLKLEFGAGAGAVRALDGVSLDLAEGETLGLVGESGSGKSLTALSIARLVPTPPARYAGGEIRVEGRDVLQMQARELRQIRGGVVSYIFQDPGSSLNPVLRVGTQIREVLKLHRPGADSDAEVLRLLRLVGIPAPEARLRQRPHELSGGMQQRVMIAMAIASRPKLLVADEPTTALDVTIQAQIIDLLRTLQAQMGMAILLITHNLGIIGDLADRVAVMYAGEVVETARTAELLRAPAHPYTQALMRSVPELGQGTARLSAIPGLVPQPGAWPAGCRFHPRCRQAQPVCGQSRQSLAEVLPEHAVRCAFWKETHELARCS